MGPAIMSRGSGPIWLLHPGLQEGVLACSSPECGLLTTGLFRLCTRVWGEHRGRNFTCSIVPRTALCPGTSRPAHHDLPQPFWKVLCAVCWPSAPRA